MGEALAEVSSEEGMVQSQAGGTARLGWGELSHSHSHSHMGPKLEAAGRLLQLLWGPGGRGGHTLGGWRSGEKVIGWSRQAGGPDAEIRTPRGPDVARLTWGLWRKPRPQF